MASKRMKHLNALRMKAAAGDQQAMQALQNELYQPHHLRRGNATTARMKRMGVKRTATTHITAKTHRAVKAITTLTAAGSLDVRVDRLNMLKVRAAAREMRNAA